MRAFRSASVNVNSATAQSLVGEEANRVIRVYKVFLVFGGAGTVTFRDGTTDLTGGMAIPANGSIVLEWVDGTPLFETTAGNAFKISCSAAVQVGGRIWYTIGS